MKKEIYTKLRITGRIASCIIELFVDTGYEGDLIIRKEIIKDIGYLCKLSPSSLLGAGGGAIPCDRFVIKYENLNNEYCENKIAIVFVPKQGEERRLFNRNMMGINFLENTCIHFDANVGNVRWRNHICAKNIKGESFICSEQFL